MEIMSDTTRTSRLNVNHISANRLAICKCKTLKLSANDTFMQTKGLLTDIKFYDESHDIQHLAPAQIVTDLAQGVMRYCLYWYPEKKVLYALLVPLLQVPYKFFLSLVTVRRCSSNHDNCFWAHPYSSGPCVIGLLFY